jgi:23S rRNA (pseudouridine1915-N3)-methyltransferase
MRLTLIAVGRIGPGPPRDLFDEYARRLRPKLALVEVEERRKLPPPELAAREADRLLAAVPKGAVAVALDERGRALPSAAFAALLGGWRDAGRDVAFLVGGAGGLDPRVRARAELVLSLGPMTWPHLLVRGLLAEQLFRAQAILAGHPYHRG